jgi:putative transposase
MDEPASSDTSGSTLSPALNNKILSLYARGLNSTEIQNLLRNSYHVYLPLPLLHSTSESVLSDYHSWQYAPLERQYPIVYFDSLAVKFRDGKDNRNHIVLFAMGIDMQGQKCPLGLWVTANEGRLAWQLVMTELKQRGVNDIFTACLYAQPGARETIVRMFPRSQVQLCVVRLVDNSLNFVTWKDRKKAAAALRVVYASDNAEVAAEAMTRFMCDCDEHYPAIGQLWRAHWDQMAELFKLPIPLREAIYSTSAILSLRQSLAKVSKRHGIFTDENDLLVRMYLSQRFLARRWSRPLRKWKQVINCLATAYENRLQIKI